MTIRQRLGGLGMMALILAAEFLFFALMLSIPNPFGDSWGATGAFALLFLPVVVWIFWGVPWGKPPAFHELEDPDGAHESSEPEQLG